MSTTRTAIAYNRVTTARLKRTDLQPSPIQAVTRYNRARNVSITTPQSFGCLPAASACSSRDLDSITGKLCTTQYNLRSCRREKTCNCAVGIGVQRGKFVASRCTDAGASSAADSCNHWLNRRESYRTPINLEISTR